MRKGALVAVLVGLAASSAWADDWGNFANISSTMGAKANRLCIGEGTRNADIGCPTYAPNVSPTGSVGIGTSNPNAKLDVYGTISATNFVGDGSGLSGITADSTDRITSGTTQLVVISNTGYISLTQAGANTGWFSPYTGLVTLGVSATGPVSGSQGYFAGRVGIGTTSPGYDLEVSRAGSNVNMYVTNVGDYFPSFGLRRVSGSTKVDQSWVQRVGSSGNWLLNDETNGTYPITVESGTADNVLYLDSSNKVGINTSSPGGTLGVVGTISATDAIQVSGTSLTCTVGIPGAIQYTGGNLQYCNGSSWTTLASAANAGAVSNTGAIQFNAGSGAFGGDTANLFWDNGNKRLGIGTINPVHKLDMLGGGMRIQRDGLNPYILFQYDSTAVSQIRGVSPSGLLFTDGAASPWVIIDGSGRLGVGRTAPAEKLDVNNSLRVGADGNLTVYPIASAYGTETVGLQTTIDNSSLSTETFVNAESRYSMVLQPIKGFVGIGISPSVKLEVGGTISATGLVVNGVSVTGSGGGAVSNTGALQFSADGAGAFGGDASNLFWDNANKRLGVGTATPEAGLHTVETTLASVPMFERSGANTDQVWVGARFLATKSSAIGDGFGGGFMLSGRESGGNTNDFAYVGGIRDGADNSGAIAFTTYSLGASGERMRIASGGNVGIGTTNPFNKLDVRGSVADGIGYTRTDAKDARITVGDVSKSWSIASGWATAGDFSLIEEGVSGNRLYVQQGTGNVGIGTSSPGAALEIRKDTAAGTSDVLALSNYGDANGQTRLLFNSYRHAVSNFTQAAIQGTYVAGGLHGGLTFQTANSGVLYDRMFIGHDGHVGISTTNPKANLDVAGTISATDAIQVGTSSLACSSGIPGALRYSSGTIQVCNGSGWTSVGGASALASLTDVVVTNVAGRDYLRYDFASSKWVNISESAVMSTTTILPNWPDAILCSDGSGVGGLGRVLYNRGATSGAVIYQMPIDTSNLSVQFNVNGTYSTNSGLSGYDCINKTIATLYSEGKGFNFIGNTGAGGDGALGDRIISGTTSVVAVSNTGLIQINTSGVNTGYFDGAGRLVVPGVSITTANGISSTNGYFTGKVGIGTTSPVADLDIHGFRLKNDGSNVSVHNTTAGATLFYNTIGTNDSSLAYRLHVTASNTMALSVLNNGNVGINATTPKAKLDVAGTISASDAIQVGTSGLSCSSGIAGSMRYSTTSSTLEYCNGNNWSSMGPSATIAFALKQMGANQASLVAADTITFNTQVSIAGTDITTTGNQIVLAPGHTYEIGASIRGNSTSGTPLLDYRVYDVTHGAYVGLPGNAGMGGATYTDTPALAFVAPTVATTYEVRVVGVAGAAPTAIANGSKFYAVKLGGGNGGSAGGASVLSELSDVNTGGAAAGKVLRYDGSSWVVSDSGGAIASLSDVQLTGLSGRDYLRYDAGISKWVNISESTVMNTTTMVNGWPDAIICNVTNPNWGKGVFTLVHGPAADGYYYYRMSMNTNADPWVRFSSSGGFTSASGLAAHDCNVSMATIASGGRAFNFIGNSGGGSSASAVSGTGALQFSADGAGAFGGDASNLFWNNSTKRLGIGTSSPARTLDINGTVQVKSGDTGITGSVSSSWLALNGDPAGFGTGPSIILRGSNAGGAGNIDFYVGASRPAQILANGNAYFVNKVGIGTASPLGKLSVAGTISASDAIQVGTSSLSCTAGIPGALKYNAGSIQVCNGSGWTSVGGASALASLTDVAVTNVAGRDYLRYDAGSSKWVNISESTVMSTTTMVPNWPDAILCNVTNPNWGTVVFYATFAPWTGNGDYYYRANVQSGTAYSIVFSSDGNFSSYANLTTTNCNTSISSLYGAGRAFNFIGNNGGGSSASAVSGTGALQFSADGAGAFGGDASNLFWNNSTKRLGIGTASPLGRLSVAGTESETSVTYENLVTFGVLGGKVGAVYRDYNGTNNYLGVESHNVGNSVKTPIVLQEWGGNVGIGTASPLGKLSVAGTISASDAIQVGTSSLACSSGLKGAMRYSNTSSTIEYCQGTAWVSMGPSATDVPAFNVNKGGTNQTVSNGAWTKVTWSDEDFDTYNNFSSSRFTPTVAGKYVLSASTACSGGTRCYVGLYKNGTIFNSRGGTGVDRPTVVEVLDMNGSTDYVEVYVYNDGGTSINGGSFYSRFSGSLIASGNGLAGGGGGSALNDLTDVNTSGAAAGKVLRYDGSSWVVSDSGGAIASLSDVQLTGLSGRDYLRYDAGSSKWVNISESTVMSTTTMVDGWPDAIVCTLTNPNWGLVTFYPFHMPYVGNGKYYYRNINSSTNYDIIFNADKSFSGYQNISAANCNKSIATLYTDGQAFNYIGNNGSGSSSAAAVSGTGALQFSADGAGAFGGDAANLFWDNANKRLGIGTASPAFKLDAEFSGASDGVRFRRADTSTTVYVHGSAGDPQIRFDRNGDFWSMGNDAGVFSIERGSNLAGSGTGLYVNSSGNVGIATTSPKTRLDVQVSSTEAGPMSAALTYEPGSGQGVEVWNTSDQAAYSGLYLRTRSTGASSWSINNEWQNAYLGDLTFVTRIGGSSLAERMRITSGGNVGIGTTNPNTRLEVSTSVEASMTAPLTLTNNYLASGTEVALRLAPSNAPDVRYAAVSAFNEGANDIGLKFYTRYGSFNEKMRITPSGYIGIGTTSPLSALDVSGTIRHSGIVIDLSDRRLKTDIHTLPPSLEELMKLEPVSFRMKASPAQKELGFIAQDMRIVFPDLVVEANDPSKTLSMNYVGLIAPMVKGMQELKAANDNLVSKTEHLERQLKAANDNGALLGRKLDLVLDELKELKQANKK